jgi:hypothetical protein
LDAVSINGAFQGMMAPTTPTGTRLVKRKRPAVHEFARKPGEEANNVNHASRFAARLGRKRIAGFQSGELGNRLGLALKKRGCLEQQRTALARRQGGPTRQSGCRCLDRARDVSISAARRITNHFAFAGFSTSKRSPVTAGRSLPPTTTRFEILAAVAFAARSRSATGNAIRSAAIIDATD